MFIKFDPIFNSNTTKNYTHPQLTHKPINILLKRGPNCLWVQKKHSPNILDLNLNINNLPNLTTLIYVIGGISYFPFKTTLISYIPNHIFKYQIYPLNHLKYHICPIHFSVTLNFINMTIMPSYTSRHHTILYIKMLCVKYIHPNSDNSDNSDSNYITKQNERITWKNRLQNKMIFIKSQIGF